MVAFEGGATCLFEIYAHGEDIRRIIGRKGRTAEAIRGFLSNLSARDQRRYLISVIEPERERPIGVLQGRLPIHEDAKVSARVEMILLRLVQQLVDEPDTARIRRTQGQDTVIFEISAEQSESKKIIGRKGRTADILRALMVAVGGRHGLNIVLDVLELTALERVGG